MCGGTKQLHNFLCRGYCHFSFVLIFCVELAVEGNSKGKQFVTFCATGAVISVVSSSFVLTVFFFFTAMNSLLTSSASCPVSVVDCGTPMLPPGGQAIPAPNTTTFGSTFSFDCDYLHDVLGSNNLGTNIITCAGDSYWTFFDISCIGQFSSSVRKEKQNHAVFVCTHVHMHVCVRAYACRQMNT